MRTALHVLEVICHLGTAAKESKSKIKERCDPVFTEKENFCCNEDMFIPTKIQTFLF
jgi:hypothetical protein